MQAVVRITFSLTLAVAGCGDEGLSPSTLLPLATCEDGPSLFGSPGPNTGLSDSQCHGTCLCGGQAWTSPTYDLSDLQALRDLRLDNPPALLESDPYASQPSLPASEEVCGVVLGLDKTSYQLVTFESEAVARHSGAQITHRGACGLCSSLQDLAVYIEHRELTSPVRECGIQFLVSPAEEHIACLQNLGFSLPCAQIWYYNTLHTRQACGPTCFQLANSPHHESDGRLNACLQCDEDHSGEVFKAIAGRTRRNTGVASELCRPCSELTPLTHRYR